MLKLNRKFSAFLILAIAVCFFLTGRTLAQSNQIVTAGSLTTAVAFPAGNCTYNWTSDNPAIGLPASGAGNIAAFTSINSGNTPLIAHITAVPMAGQFAYITNFNDNTVSVININNNTVVSTISVGTGPYGVAVSTDGSKVYVTNSTSNDVSIIDATTNTVIKTLSGFLSPKVVVISPDGSKVYVVNSGGSSISEISTATNTVTSSIPIAGAAANIAITPDGKTLYVFNNSITVYVIDAATHTVSSNFNLIGISGAATISPDGTVLYVGAGAGAVQMINIPANTPKGVFNAGNTVIQKIAVSPDNARVYVSDEGASFDLAMYLLSTGQTYRLSMLSAKISGIAFTPDGRYLYCNDSSINSIQVMDNLSLLRSTTIAVGANPTTIGNFISPVAQSCSNGNTLTFSITVNPTSTGPQLTTTGTPSAVTTVYGTPSSYTTFTLSGANLTGPATITAPAGFEVSIDGVNFVSASTVSAAFLSTPKTIYIRLSKVTSAGTHSGNIDIATSGAADVQVAMPQSTVTPFPLAISVFGSKNYGTASANFTAGPSDLDFSQWNNQIPNGEVINALDISFTAGTAATDAAIKYVNAIHVANAQGTNGFLAANYNITYQPNDLTILPALLTVTAANYNKPAGTAITGGTITSGYTTSGLQNGESITNVTVTYGNGAAASASAGTYNGSVVLTNAVGANGFLTSNYSITYVPAAIVVSASASVITAAGTLTPLTTVYGTPSSAETFTVSGANMTAGILITAPAGFEVSTDDINFTATVAIGGGSGTVAPTTIYIRLAAKANAGTYSGNIVMSSTGAANATLSMPASTVVPAPLTITASAVTKLYGDVLTATAGYIKEIPNGLKNGEAIASVTVSYTGGNGATDIVGLYSKAISVSKPIAVAGDTFSPGNYNITYIAGDLTVTPVTLTVTANNQTRQYGYANPTLTYTYAGFVNGEDSLALTKTPKASTTAIISTPTGQYPITLSGGVAVNYTFNYVPGTLNITPAPGQTISIPNTFTPNGDGINDTWNIANLNTYGQSRVQIFNRYGMLMYNSVGYAIPWDGTFNRTRMPDGTYYYIITLTPGGTPVSGFVLLIR